MKTSFLQKNNAGRRRNRSTSRTVIMLVAVVIVCSALFFLAQGPLSNAFAPLWRLEKASGNSIATLGGYFKSKAVLADENAQLKSELANDEDVILSLEAASSSYAQLLSTFGRSPLTGIPATVLVRPPETPYDDLIIDAGSNNGIAVGAVVSLPSGIAIGDIASVSTETSRVSLYSSPV